MRIVKWLDDARLLESRVGDEAVLTCPSCQRPKLYFNTAKLVGHCHYAKCRFHISPVMLQDLVDVIGHAPSSEPEFISWQQAADVSLTVDKFPEAAQRLLIKKSGQLLTHFPRAVEAITLRGVVPEDQFRFNMHFSGKYVYIPVYFGGLMVSYLGRLAWWMPMQGLRYDNALDVKISNYLFNFDQAKFWGRLTLIENTFNAISYHEHSQTVSTFGSRLSAAQIKLVAASKARSVAILWDEGAEASAEKAAAQLQKRAVPTCYGKIKGQPDDYNPEWIRKAVNELHIAATRGEKCLTLT